MSNMMSDSPSDSVVGFMIGLCVALIGFGIYGLLHLPNISEAELYRFCMVHEIKLEECKIPVTPFKDEKHE